MKLKPAKLKMWLINGLSVLGGVFRLSGKDFTSLKESILESGDY